MRGAGPLIAAYRIVPSDLVGREQGSGRQVRAQVDEPKLGAELADAVQGLAQDGFIDVAMPEALCEVSLHPENLLPLDLGFLEHLDVQALDRRVLVRPEREAGRPRPHPGRGAARDTRSPRRPGPAPCPFH
ncbi:MAG: hypothetical protein MZV70_30145 [Desulfobacterales bacterium]|nr:hypothetical protein [Desulfobacterales bacterium]